MEGEYSVAAAKIDKKGQGTRPFHYHDKAESQGEILPYFAQFESRKVWNDCWSGKNFHSSLYDSISTTASDATAVPKKCADRRRKGDRRTDSEKSNSHSRVPFPSHSPGAAPVDFPCFRGNGRATDSGGVWQIRSGPRLELGQYVRVRGWLFRRRQSCCLSKLGKTLRRRIF